METVFLLTENNTGTNSLFYNSKILLAIKEKNPETKILEKQIIQISFLFHIYLFFFQNIAHFVWYKNQTYY